MSSAGTKTVAASPLFNSLTETLVAGVVADVSARMSEPAFAEASIGAFIAAHPDASRFVVLKLSRGGQSEAAMHALFHLEVLSECLRRARGGREAPQVDFARLDEVSTEAPFEALRATSPVLATYVQENVDEALRDVVAHVALALLPS